MSYHGLIDARMRASDKDLPVIQENPTKMPKECDLIGSISNNLNHADCFQKPSNLSALKKYLDTVNFQATTGEFQQHLKSTAVWRNCQKTKFMKSLEKMLMNKKVPEKAKIGEF